MRNNVKSLIPWAGIKAAVVTPLVEFRAKHKRTLGVLKQATLFALYSAFVLGAIFYHVHYSQRTLEWNKGLGLLATTLTRGSTWQAPREEQWAGSLLELHINPRIFTHNLMFPTNTLVIMNLAHPTLRDIMGNTSGEIPGRNFI